MLEIYTESVTIRPQNLSRARNGKTQTQNPNYKLMIQSSSNEFLLPENQKGFSRIYFFVTNGWQYRLQ